MRAPASQSAAIPSRGAAFLRLADETSNVRALIIGSGAGWSAERKAEELARAKKVVAGCRGADLFLEIAIDQAADALEAILAEQGWKVPA